MNEQQDQSLIVRIVSPLASPLKFIGQLKDHIVTKKAFVHDYNNKQDNLYGREKCVTIYAPRVTINDELEWETSETPTPSWSCWANSVTIDSAFKKVDSLCVTKTPVPFDRHALAIGSRALSAEIFAKNTSRSGLYSRVQSVMLPLTTRNPSACGGYFDKIVNMGEQPYYDFNQLDDDEQLIMPMNPPSFWHHIAYISVVLAERKLFNKAEFGTAQEQRAFQHRLLRDSTKYLNRDVNGVWKCTLPFSNEIIEAKHDEYFGINMVIHHGVFAAFPVIVPSKPYPFIDHDPADYYYYLNVLKKLQFELLAVWCAFPDEFGHAMDAYSIVSGAHAVEENTTPVIFLDKPYYAPAMGSTKRAKKEITEDMSIDTFRHMFLTQFVDVIPVFQRLNNRTSMFYDTNSDKHIINLDTRVDKYFQSEWFFQHVITKNRQLPWFKKHGEYLSSIKAAGLESLTSEVSMLECIIKKQSVVKALRIFAMRYNKVASAVALSATIPNYYAVLLAWMGLGKVTSAAMEGDIAKLSKSIVEAVPDLLNMIHDFAVNVMNMKPFEITEHNTHIVSDLRGGLRNIDKVKYRVIQWGNSYKQRRAQDAMMDYNAKKVKHKKMLLDTGIVTQRINDDKETIYEFKNDIGEDVEIGENDPPFLPALAKEYDVNEWHNNDQIRIDAKNIETLNEALRELPYGLFVYGLRDLNTAYTQFIPNAYIRNTIVAGAVPVIGVTLLDYVGYTNMVIQAMSMVFMASQRIESITKAAATDAAIKTTTGSIVKTLNSVAEFARNRINEIEGKNEASAPPLSSRMMNIVYPTPPPSSSSSSSFHSSSPPSPTSPSWFYLSPPPSNPPSSSLPTPTPVFQSLMSSNTESRAVATIPQSNKRTTFEPLPNDFRDRKSLRVEKATVESSTLFDVLKERYYSAPEALRKSPLLQAFILGKKVDEKDSKIITQWMLEVHVSPDNKYTEEELAEIRIWFDKSEPDYNSEYDVSKLILAVTGGLLNLFAKNLQDKLSKQFMDMNMPQVAIDQTENLKKMAEESYEKLPDGSSFSSFFSNLYNNTLVLRGLELGAEGFAWITEDIVAPILIESNNFFANHPLPFGVDARWAIGGGTASAAIVAFRRAAGNYFLHSRYAESARRFDELTNRIQKAKDISSYKFAMTTAEIKQANAGYSLILSNQHRS